MIILLHLHKIDIISIIITKSTQHKITIFELYKYTLSIYFEKEFMIHNDKNLKTHPTGNTYNNYENLKWQRAGKK